MNPVLETSRLALRTLDLADLDFIAAMLAHPEVMRFWPRCYSRDQAEAWIRRQQDRYAQDGCGYWLAIDKASGHPVGQAGILILEIDGAVEAGLGYLIHRPFWQRGYATEAAAACCGYAFSALGKPRIVAPIRPENAGSQAVARKLGMQPERQTLYAGFDHLIFVLARATWASQP
ncbi:MAG TPA: GNAT family N-acetyltransferase [Roseiflexaceae bacterium]|nr:GNAT family N-acetyltransferase [Roseiflexaceae bacterium]